MAVALVVGLTAASGAQARPGDAPVTGPRGPAAGGLAPHDVPAALRSVQPTRSWYVTTTDPRLFDTAGCALGTAQRSHTGTRNGVVALLFGGVQPGAAGWTFDLYRKRTAPTGEIVDAAAAYAAGYQRCVAPAADARLVLVVSTTTSLGRIDATAGAFMADVAAAATARIEPTNPQVWVLGGNDVELGYVGPTQARLWVSAYHARAGRALVNVGDAAGCPGNRVPSGDDCGSVEFPAWTAADVWAVNGGLGPTLVLPGIYVTDGIQARQWANLDRFAMAASGRSIAFLGALSQLGACQERPCTDRVRNTPDASWSQLRDELGRDGLFASDMGWLNDQP